MGMLQDAGSPNLESELQETVRQFEALQRRCATMLDGISMEQFNWRPSADRWSIAQNLDHLNREAREQAPVVEGLIERGIGNVSSVRVPSGTPGSGTGTSGFWSPPTRSRCRPCSGLSRRRPLRLKRSCLS